MDFQTLTVAIGNDLPYYFVVFIDKPSIGVEITPKGTAVPDTYIIRPYPIGINRLF